MGRRSDRARIARIQRIAALPARIGLARSGDARALLGGNSPAQKAAVARRMKIPAMRQTNLVGSIDDFGSIFLVGSHVAQIGVKSICVMLQCSYCAMLLWLQEPHRAHRARA